MQHWYCYIKGATWQPKKEKEKEKKENRKKKRVAKLLQKSF